MFDEALLLFGRHEPEQVSWLDVVIIDTTFLFVVVCVAGDLQRWFSEGRVFFGAIKAVGFVIWGSTAVVIEPHEAIALIVGDFGSMGAVDGEAFEVDAEAVAVCVGVGEDTGLKHFARGEGDARHDIRG